MILLDAMMDSTFTLKDTLMLVGMLGGIVATWFTIRFKIERLEDWKKEFVDNYKLDLMNAKNGRSAMRKEFSETVEKREQVLHQRVDRLRDENLKTYDKLEAKVVELETKIDAVKTQINDQTGKILTAISEMKTKTK